MLKSNEFEEGVASMSASRLAAASTVALSLMLGLTIATRAGPASASPTLEITSPTPETFTFGTDFLFASNSKLADLTGVFAIDAGESTGCSPYQLAPSTTIVVIQRGFCTFDAKVAAAFAAGAQAIIIYNSGLAMQTGVFQGATTAPELPVAFTSFAVGQILVGQAGATIHLVNDQVPVPEPSSTTIVCLGLLTAALAKARPSAWPFWRVARQPRQACSSPISLGTGVARDAST